MEVKWFKGSENLEEGFAIRREVFVEEQKVPLDMEIDELDKNCNHIVVYNNGEAIAVGRIIFEAHKCFLGRIAVVKKYRGKGIGEFLVKEMLKKAFDDGIKEVFIHAQAYAEGFYKKIGFRAYGEKFYEAGIEHISMIISSN